MIVNGNYEYFDIKSLSNRLIEAFVSYYGEKYREILTKKINEFNYRPFHSKNFVIDYYNHYMYKLRNEIADDFFERTGIEKTPEREKIINMKNPDDVSALLYVCEGGYDINNNDLFTENGKKKIIKLRNKVSKIFELEGTDDEIFTKLLELSKSYKQSLKAIENKYDCDVFQDVRKLEENEKIALQCLYKEAKRLGYDVDFEDIVYISKDDFELSSIYNLKGYRKLFGMTFDEPGILESFTSKNTEILESDASIDKKLKIIINRLKYIYSIDIPFKYITKDDLNNVSDNPLYVQTIINEYEYQKKFKVTPETVDYWGYSLNEIKRNFRKGEFFPTDLADEIEEYRLLLINTHYQNCKFNTNRYPFPQTEDTNFITRFNFKNNDITQPFSEIFLNEDQCLNNISFLKVLIHEINHAISQSIYDIRKDDVILKCGLEYWVTKRNKTKVAFEQDEKLPYDPDLQLLDENINERQTREILDILLKQGKLDLGLGKDTIYKEPKHNFNCTYDIYNFLTEEFYDNYHEELKLQRVDPDYDIFFKKHTNFDSISGLKKYLSNKFNRLLTFSGYSRKGKLDYYKTVELGRILSDYSSMITSNYNGNYDELINILDPEIFNNLDKNVQKEIVNFILKKDDLLDSMSTDSKLSHGNDVISQPSDFVIKMNHGDCFRPNSNDSDSKGM